MTVILTSENNALNKFSNFSKLGNFSNKLLKPKWLDYIHLVSACIDKFLYYQYFISRFIFVLFLIKCFKLMFVKQIQYCFYNTS